MSTVPCNAKCLEPGCRGRCTRVHRGSLHDHACCLNPSHRWTTWE